MKSVAKEIKRVARKNKKVKSNMLLGGSAKTGRRNIIILTTANVYCKAKLGFTRKAADTTFYHNSNAIATAIRLNVKKFYSPMFEDIDLLDSVNESYNKAMAAIALGGLGKVGKKNAKKLLVKNVLDSALAYINQLARANPLYSEEIITGAKLQICKRRSGNKKQLRAKHGLNLGEILLYTIAVKRNGKYVDATYFWQYSIDGGEIWEDIDANSEATVLVQGLKKTKTLFRQCSKTKKGGKTVWCVPVEITPKG